MNTSYQPNPTFGVPDILMMTGSDNYNVPEYIAEAMRDGVSKRISISSIVPEMQPGVSNIYIWHRQAIPLVNAQGLSISDLVDDLIASRLLDEDAVDRDELYEWEPDGLLLPEDFVPSGVLAITCAIQRDPKVRAELESKYSLTWQGGVILSSPLGKFRYILKDDETELPEHLQPYAHLIQAVRVVRVDDDGDEREDE